MSIQKANMPKKITVSTISKMKGCEAITMITAYDALFAKLFDGKVDMILVGDSLNMSFFGADDTISATMEQMIYHTKAVCNGAKHSMIVMDMPFGSYSTPTLALANATKAYQETNALAVKIEGGAEKSEVIKTLTQNSIAVLGHIGLMPQFLRSAGGYKVRGKDDEDIAKLIADAKAIEEAGAFALVVEGVKSEAGKAISEAIKIPTIGIGAGVDCDGQVLVWSDAFGFFEDFKPKFVKRYLDGGAKVKEALETYTQEVKNRAFPSDEFTY